MFRKFGLIVFVILFHSLPLKAEINPSKLKVFIIYSYLPGIWSYEGTLGVKSGFASNRIEPIIKEYIYDYISLLNKPKEIIEIEKNKVQDAITKFSPNIIIIFDDEAADALVDSLNHLQIPIVLTGINKYPNEIKWYKAEREKGRYFTGVWERYPFDQSIRMLKQLNSSIREISILTSANESSKIITNQLIKFFKENSMSFEGIKLQNINITSSWKEWRQVITDYKGKDKSFWIVCPWNVNDENGQEIDLRAIGNYYRNNSKLPSLGMGSINQELGFLASFAVSSEDLGFQASAMASLIIQKMISPRDMPFEEVNTVRFVINKKCADETGIKIPIHLLEYATIEKKIPMKFKR